MDRDLHSEQPNVGSLRTYRSQSDLTYSYNRAMGIDMIAHRVGHVSLGVARRSGRHAQQTFSFYAKECIPFNYVTGRAGKDGCLKKGRKVWSAANATKPVPVEPVLV